MHKEIPTRHRIWGQTILIAVLIFNAIAQLFVLYPMSINLGQGVVPWLIGHGKVLYVDIYENRAPLTSWIIALVQPLFGGDTFLTARLLHLLVVLLTVLLVYVVTLRLGRSVIAASAAVLYLTALQSVFVNVLFYYEVLQGLFYVGVVCLLMNNRAERRRLFAAGILLGLALLTKQQAVLSIAFTVLWSLVGYRRWHPAVVLIAGVIAPVALAAGWYMLNGTLGNFIYWTVTVNVQYGTKLVGTLTGDFIRRMLLAHVWMIPFGLMTLSQSAGQRRAYVLIWGLALLGLANQYPGLGEIHVALQLPLVAVQAGVVLAHTFADVTWKRDWLAERAPGVGLSIGVLAIISFNVATSYIPSPAGYRRIIGIDDLRPISDWIAQHASPGDTLYVLPSTDSNPQIHVLTQLPPPHTYSIVNRYVLSAPIVSQKLLAEWQEHPPIWIVYFPEMAQENFPPTAQPLITFIRTRYTMQNEFADLPFYGSAQVLHVRDISEQ